LAGGGKRGAFLVPDADPFNVAPSDCVGERIERVADQPENVPDADLLQSLHQYVGHSVSHRCLLLIRAGVFSREIKNGFSRIVFPQLLCIKIPSAMLRFWIMAAPGGRQCRLERRRI
jgi:hypothetical protein